VKVVWKKSSGKWVFKKKSSENPREGKRRGIARKKKRNEPVEKEGQSIGSSFQNFRVGAARGGGAVKRVGDRVQAERSTSRTIS